MSPAELRDYRDQTTWDSMVVVVIFEDDQSFSSLLPVVHQFQDFLGQSVKVHSVGLRFIEAYDRRALARFGVYCSPLFVS